MLFAKSGVDLLVRFLLPLVLYGCVAVATTWPLVCDLHRGVLVGTEVAQTVPQFNAWTIWWNADRAAAGFQGYWGAPIFFPAPKAFVMSEPQPMTLLVAPVLWSGGGALLAANLYLLVSLILNALSADLLLRRMGGGLVIAVGTGVAVEVLPIVHWQVGVLQLVPVWGVVWTLAALRGICCHEDSGTSRQNQPAQRLAWWRRIWSQVSPGVNLGLAFSATMLSCIHHGLFLGVLLLGVLPWMGRAWLGARWWSSFGAAAVVVAGICGPFVIQLRSLAKQYDFARPADTVAQLSAVIGDYTAVYGQTLGGWNEGLGRPHWYLNPGWGKVLLGIVGMVIGWGAPRVLNRFSHRPSQNPSLWRRWTTILVLFVVLSVVLSLGTNLQLFGWQPWWSLVKVIPGLEQVRNVFRFGYFAQLSLVLLAAQGVLGIGGWIAGRSLRLAEGSGSRKGGRWLWVGLGLLAMIAALDPWPPRAVLGRGPDVAAHADWAEQLRRAIPPGSPIHGRGVLCLPMAAGNDVRDFEVSTQWMLIGSLHQQWLVNGYSGFFPPQYFEIRSKILSSGMTREIVEQLVTEGVGWIVVDRQRSELPWEDRWDWGRVEARRVFRGAAGVDLYRLGLEAEPLSN